MNKVVGWVLAGSIAFLGVFDLVMMVKLGPYQTISWFVWNISQEYPILLVLAGAILGHLTFPMKGLVDKETLEVLKFYADKRTWLREPDTDYAVRIDAEDCDEMSGYARWCGGKKARELLKKKGLS